MEKTQFESYIQSHLSLLGTIKSEAWSIHERVGQTYDTIYPYGYHLAMVADAVLKFGHEVILDDGDILPVVFAAYFHDSIEDARLTYNDVKSIAGKFMGQEQSILAAEIVYALTNDKGRTREERAGEHYYAGIRETPFAPFVKLCDRWANMTYSAKKTNRTNKNMYNVYKFEWLHFISAITVSIDDVRFTLPCGLIAEIENLYDIKQQ